MAVNNIGLFERFELFESFVVNSVNSIKQRQVDDKGLNYGLPLVVASLVTASADNWIHEATVRHRR